MIFSPHRLPSTLESEFSAFELSILYLLRFTTNRCNHCELKSVLLVYNRHTKSIFWLNVLLQWTNSLSPMETQQIAFKLRQASRESKLKECEGFVAFSIMGNDTGSKGHGVIPVDKATEPSYLSAPIWKDRASFNKCTEYSSNAT